MSSIPENPIKILNCMFLKWHAGTENAFIEYALALKESGFDVLNLIHPKAKIIEILENKNLLYAKSKFLGRFGKKDIFTILYFKYLIKKYKINIVFSHHGRLISLFKEACGKEVKLIGVNHGYNPKHNVGVDYAITLNKYALNQTIKLGQKSNKITVLPNSIKLDDQDFLCYKKTKPEFVIGSYGRFSPEKGYETFVDSLVLLQQKGINFKAIVGGVGDEQKLLQNKIRQHGLNNKVELIGWVKNKAEFFRKIDLFVLPSLEEEFGITMLESMKYHTPIMATKCYGPIDVISDNNNGFLVDIGNSNLMAQKIEDIISNPSTLKNVVYRAYNILQQNYTYKHFRQKLSKIVTTLV